METVSHLFRRSHYLYLAYVRLLGWLLGWRKRSGVKVMEQDWDTLIVLDACRADIFEEENNIPGEFETVRSVGTETPQWLKRNFSGFYNDVVYVAGNPYVSDLATDGYFDAEQHFHHVEHVWREDWNDKTGTVLPSTMNNAVRRVMEEYPEKRVIAHYMQPHEPFIGETKLDPPETWEEAWRLWHHPELKEAYRENLRIVLESVKELLSDLDGRTVITGDHGEILDGSYGLIRHPTDVFIQETCEVPWFKVGEDIKG